MGLIKVIEWYEQDGQPLAHVELIELGLSINELQSLISDLRETQDEMIWFAAEWLQVSTLSVNKSHLLRKADYENDDQHKALCGKLPNGAWDEHWTVSPLIDGPGSLHICQVCLKIWEKTQQK